MGSASTTRRRSSMSRRRTSGRRSSMRSSTMTTNNKNNWRNSLSQDSRQKIVNKITDTLQRHMPLTGPDGMHELKKIALRFEEKIYVAAVDQQDYLRKISLKMLSLRNHVSRDGNSLAGGSYNSNQKSMDPGGYTRSAMDSASTVTTNNNNWRDELSQDSRQKIVNKMAKLPGAFTEGLEVDSDADSRRSAQEALKLQFFVSVFCMPLRRFELERCDNEQFQFVDGQSTEKIVPGTKVRVCVMGIRFDVTEVSCVATMCGDYLGVISADDSGLFD